MGRAMVREPKAFLMDEPLSNLDAKLRVSMRGELARLHDRLGVTTIYVTHDQIEAMTLGQRVAVLRDGVLQQVDTPADAVHAPANLFVAAFIGSPSMNLVEADVGDGVVRFAGHELPLPAGQDVPAGRADRRDPPDGLRARRVGAIRRCHACVVRRRGGRRSRLRGARDLPARRASGRRGGGTRGGCRTWRTTRRALFADDQRSLFTARVDGPVPIRPGSAVELAVDTRPHALLRSDDRRRGRRRPLGAGADAAPVTH